MEPASAPALPLAIGPSLREHARWFLSRPVPRVMVLALGAAIAARLILGRFDLLDAAIVAGAFLLYPFIEWALHVFLLHAPARRIGGRTVELGIARNHRAHHADPADLSKSLPDTSRNLGMFALGIAVPTVLFVPAWPQRATVFVAALTGLLAYEWCHFLIHTRYVPRHAPFRRARRNHLLHHHRDETKWFGVVATVADSVLGTAPRPARRPPETASASSGSSASSASSASSGSGSADPNR